MSFQMKDLRPDVPLDYAQCPEIYADGAATVELLGPNIRVTYFTWNCDPGAAIVKRMPVARIVRPASSFVIHSGGLLSALVGMAH